MRINMKCKSNIKREHWKNDSNKRRGLKASVLIDAGSPSLGLF